MTAAAPGLDRRQGRDEPREFVGVEIPTARSRPADAGVEKMVAPAARARASPMKAANSGVTVWGRPAAMASLRAVSSDGCQAW